jgi:hypothetical protein
MTRLTNLKAMENRAVKYLARQDDVLVRAVARVWKAHERGKLLERVKAVRVVKDAWAVWKGCLRKQDALEGKHFFRTEAGQTLISVLRSCSCFRPAIKLQRLLRRENMAPSLHNTS